MIVWIMTTAFTVFTAAVVLYFIAPGAVFNVAMAIARRSAGLHLKETTVDGHRVPYLEGGHGVAARLAPRVWCEQGSLDDDRTVSDAALSRHRAGRAGLW